MFTLKLILQANKLPKTERNNNKKYKKQSITRHHLRETNMLA